MRLWVPFFSLRHQLTQFFMPSHSRRASGFIFIDSVVKIFECRNWNNILTRISILCVFIEIRAKYAWLQMIETKCKQMWIISEVSNTCLLLKIAWKLLPIRQWMQCYFYALSNAVVVIAVFFQAYFAHYYNAR